MESESGKLEIMDGVVAQRKENNKHGFLLRKMWNKNKNMEIAALLFFLTQRNSLAITRETPPLFYLIIIYFTYFTFPHFPTLCFRSHYRLHIHKQGYAI